MAIKKSQLYASLWSSCDALRGGMDASQYKDYVLTLLFMKYVSDRAAGDPQSLIRLPDRGGFKDMVRLKGKKGIGDEINKIIGRLAEANDLKGVIDQADFNDESKLGRGPAMRDRLSKLVAIFEGLDLRANRAGGDDLLGDAYEYLMRHFATESGKSKGQFYTPAEVSRIVAKVVGLGPTTRSDHTIYDPTCGSGSLLLKAADEAPNGITIYGQEMDNATYALARMNMILHGYETADLKHGDTLADPGFLNETGGIKTFDFSVANPPFSFKEWTSGVEPEHDPFHRFEYGVPPAKNGDYAFLLHLLKSLGPRGKGAIILPHGVLFRGNREGAIRRELLRRGLIAGVIGLPPNLFYGTGIPACIVVLDKAAAAARKGVFMIDASLGFRKDGNKNRLRAQDIHRIVDVFTNRVEQPRYSRMVPLIEINDPINDYNLNLPRYIDTSKPEDIHDLDAHLNGGIPNREIDALGEYWDALPGLKSDLLHPMPGRPGYSELSCDPQDLRRNVTEHRDYAAYRHHFETLLENWTEAHAKRLQSITDTDTPNQVIEILSDDLRRRFQNFPLLNPYDIYQQIRDYWDATMADDVHLIVSVGWRIAATPRPPRPDSAKNGKAFEKPDITIGRQKYRLDLLPPELLAARFFPEQLSRLNDSTARHSGALVALTAFVDEHSAEDGALSATSEETKITRKTATARLQVLRTAPSDSETDADKRTLAAYLELANTEATLKAKMKANALSLNRQVLAQYARLTVPKIAELAVFDKWFPSIRNALNGLLQAKISTLSATLCRSAERYSATLHALDRQAVDIRQRTRDHLRRIATL